MNLMAGHRCPIIHLLNPKARVDVKNDRLEAIKATLRLSPHHVHALMFEVGFYFWSLTTTNPIIKEAKIYLEHQCPQHKVHLKLICHDCMQPLWFKDWMILSSLRPMHHTNYEWCGWGSSPPCKWWVPQLNYNESTTNQPTWGMFSTSPLVGNGNSNPLPWIRSPIPWL